MSDGGRMLRPSRALLAISGAGLALLGGLALLLLSRQPREPTDCRVAPVWKEVVDPLVKKFHHIPCGTFVYRRPDDTRKDRDVEVRFNNFGLHAHDYSLDKPPGVFRVLLVGDSFAQGLQVAIEQGFPFKLQEWITRDSGHRVEVINLSLESYGTDREILLYAALGWQFRPDLVLLSLYPGNDIQDNEIELEARHYGHRLDRPFLTLGDSPVGKGQGPSIPPLELHNSPVFDAALFPDSPVFAWLAEAQASQSPAPPEDPPERPVVVGSAPQHALEYPVQLGLYLPEDTHWSRAWRLTERLILQFRDLVEMQGIPFAVVIIPDRRAVHRQDWKGTLTKYADRLPALRQADPALPNVRLEEFLSEQGIPTLDLTGALRAWAQRRPGERLYFLYDGHFNPKGHALVARQIAGWLRSSMLTP